MTQTVNEYVKSEAEIRGLGVGAEPNFPLTELITKHFLDNVIAELPSGEEIFWYTSDTLDLMLGTRPLENDDVNCSECVELKCTINDVYSFKVKLVDGKVTALRVFSLERGQHESKLYPETDND